MTSEEQKAKRKAWREQNRDRMRELNARWYRENRERAMATRKAYREKNRERCKTLVKAWYEANKERVGEYRKRNLTRILSRQRFRRTGCSPELYKELFDKQYGLCAICGGKGGRKGLAADHCHATETVRGLLCGLCNPMIGLARDKVEILQAAIMYLQTR